MGGGVEEDYEGAEKRERVAKLCHVMDAKPWP